FRIDDHIARLRNSARVYMMEVPYSDEEIAEAIVSLVKVNGSQPCYIRPNIYLGYGSMGVSLDLSAAPSVVPCGTQLTGRTAACATG
ncbi:aminotransferase class IV, partial [Streptomyces sp. NPDC059814]|uniref:aminotransferase class IV n=1 Tax=Streptomyces sp. NPDC059814 TaxID=3346959 RepID=UPI00365A53BF